MINFMRNTKTVVAAGRQKVGCKQADMSCKIITTLQWPSRIFKVLAPTGWYVVLSDPTHVDDIRRAPDHVLSAQKVASEVCWNSLFVRILPSEFPPSNSSYKHDSLLIAERTCRTKSTFRSSERDLQKKYWHW